MPPATPISPPRNRLLGLCLLALGSCGGGEPVSFVTDPVYVELAGVSPVSTLAGSEAVDIEIHGAGFLRGITAVLNGTMLETTYVDLHLLRATVPASLIETAGPLSLQVYSANGPIPAGSLTFWVLNPRPAVHAVVPDSILGGSAVEVTVTGTDFGAGAAVWVGDTSFPATRVSDTEMRVSLPPLEYDRTRSLGVRVVNASPGGGSSTEVVRLHVGVRPYLSAAYPRTVTEGSGPFTLTIYGRGFTPDATVVIDGVARPTTVLDEGRVAVTVDASETASVGALEYVVSTGIGTTLPGWLAVVSGSQALTSSIAIERPTHGLVWDESRGLFYATARSAAEVFAVDPEDGSVPWSLDLPEEAGPIALSDDGSFLYVSYIGAPGLLRIDVERRSIDLELGLDGFVGYVGYQDIQGLRATQIETIPGVPEQVVAAVRDTCCSPGGRGLALFTGAARTELEITAGELTVVSADTLLMRSPYGGLVPIVVNGDRLRVVDGYGLGASGRLAYGAGYLYTELGDRLDARDGALRASGAMRGFMSVDVANGRIHYYSDDDGLVTAHMLSMEEIGRIELPEAWTNRDIVRWGPDGLALGNGGQYILIVRSSLIGEP